MAIVLRDWHLILFFLSLWVAAAVMFAQVGGERKQYMVSVTGVRRKKTTTHFICHFFH